MNYYINVLKKYAVFSGRASRKELWYFTLFNIIFAYIALILSNVLGLATKGYGLLNILYSLAVLLPTIAVGVRRLHDTGRSAWWFLIELIPLIGPIWFIILMAINGNPGDNKYGPSPK